LSQLNINLIGGLAVFADLEDPVAAGLLVEAAFGYEDGGRSSLRARVTCRVCPLRRPWGTLPTKFISTWKRPAVIWVKTFCDLELVGGRIVEAVKVPVWPVKTRLI
jgi:hypothetical protein